MNVPIVEEEKNQIKHYLLGQLAEADEERVELRLMSDPVFSEEFDIVVDEIATLYVAGQLEDDEKRRVEKYFLRSPERQLKLQFIRELRRQVNEQQEQLDPAPVVMTDQKRAPRPAMLPAKHLTESQRVTLWQQETLWQRISSFWTGHPSSFRTAISFAVLLIVGGLVFYVVSLNSTPTYTTVAVPMTSSQRDSGTETVKIRLEPGTDGLLINLQLPTPAAPKYRASLRGERVSLPQLQIEAQDATSITVMIRASDITPGTYAIELTEINGTEKPVRGAFVFTIVN